MTGTDARLVPAAAAAWAGCLVATGGPGRARILLAGVVVLGLVVAGHHLARRRRSPAGTPRAEGGPPATATRRRRRPPTARWLPPVALVLTALAAVLTSAAITDHLRRTGPLADLVDRGAVADLAGRLTAEPRPLALRPDRWQATLRVEEVSGRGGTGTAAADVRLLAGPELADLTVGHRLTVAARLGPADPDDVELAVAVAVAPVTVTAPPGPLDAAVHAVRSALLAVTAGLPDDARGLVPGLAVGDTSRLPPDLDEAMRATSLTHITAVSGGHFAVLLLAVVWATARLPTPARAAVTVLVMGAFVLVVRPEPAVLRAGVMGLVAVLGTLLRRPARAVPALAVAVLVLLVADPWMSRALGFALSVAATAAIVLLAPALTRAWAGRVPRAAAQAVAVPLAAQVACAPLLVPLDAGVGLYAVPANLLAAPALVPGTLVGVAAAALAAVAPTPAGWLGWVAAPAAWWIAAVARLFAGLPGAWVPVPAGWAGVALVALGGVAVVVALLGAARSRRVVPAVVVGLAVAVAAAPFARTPVRVGEWTVAMCDVGQGDMLVVRSGERAVVVVDVGPEPGPADACLRALGVTAIDLLVLSHHHLDHVGGLAGLADREVALAVVPPLAEPAAQAAEVGRLLVGVPQVVGEAGLGGRAGDVTWRVLAPARVGLDVNDASVVVHLSVAGIGVLALGDLSSGPQDALAAVVPESGLAVDVVKVAHHGARDQSAALARAASPAVALVGVGDNSYGHPTPEAMALYRGVGALVLTTDGCGTVVLSVGPGGLGSSCVGRRASAGGRLAPCLPRSPPPPGKPSPSLRWSW